MLGFVVGLVAGGAAVWMWRERLEQMVHDRSPELRTKVADQLGAVPGRAAGRRVRSSNHDGPRPSTLTCAAQRLAPRQDAGGLT
jgi:hypothetical protein